MQPLNQAETDRIAIPKKYTDHKEGFKATRTKLKGGEFGLWAKFIGLEGFGGGAGVSMEWSDSDRYSLPTFALLYLFFYEVEWSLLLYFLNQRYCNEQSFER